MKTVGNLLKEARLGKGYTRADLSEETKIKSTFIEAIEKGEWNDLPDFEIVSGFVKSMSHFLDIDERQTVSTLRRDYPPQLIQSPKFKVQENKNINRRFVWGPRLTFLVGVCAVILIVLGYLGFQYRKFNSPPYLRVDIPTDGQVVTNSSFTVIGKTDPDATVTIDNQSALLNDQGEFSTQIDVSKNTNEIDVVARSRSGKTTVIKRRIRVVL